MTPLLLKHLAGENLGRFPVWMMRQAGRYLPSYRAVREKHTFWEMATMPEVTADVSLQPMQQLPVDAVIFFSDILTLPYGRGVHVEIKESIGPVIPQPLRTAAAFEVFRDFDPAKHTDFVGKALTLIREQMPAEKALLGFAGAPWTVGSYLIEGRANKNFQQLLTWMHSDPKSLVESLAVLGEATASYLEYQTQNGAQAVQLFDTWLAEMPRAFFVEHYVPMLNAIFRRLKAKRVPTIYFTKHAHHLLEDFKSLEVDVLSVDNLLSLKDVEQRTGGKFSLQGNLDPLTLFCDPGIVRQRTRQLVQTARELSKPAIMNLGHGVLPGTPVESVRAFLEEARTLWV
jgi:uroporphyrinogen decarboxylase